MAHSDAAREHSRGGTSRAAGGEAVARRAERERGWPAALTRYSGSAIEEEPRRRHVHCPRWITKQPIRVGAAS